MLFRIKIRITHVIEHKPWNSELETQNTRLIIRNISDGEFFFSAFHPLAFHYIWTFLNWTGMTVTKLEHFWAPYVSVCLQSKRKRTKKFQCRHQAWRMMQKKNMTRKKDDCEKQTRNTKQSTMAKGVVVCHKHENLVKNLFSVCIIKTESMLGKWKKTKKKSLHRYTHKYIPEVIGLILLSLSSQHQTNSISSSGFGIRIE